MKIAEGNERAPPVIDQQANEPSQPMSAAARWKRQAQRIDAQDRNPFIRKQIAARACGLSGAIAISLARGMRSCGAMAKLQAGAAEKDALIKKGATGPLEMAGETCSLGWGWLHASFPRRDGAGRGGWGGGSHLLLGKQGRRG